MRASSDRKCTEDVAGSIRKYHSVLGFHEAKLVWNSVFMRAAFLGRTDGKKCSSPEEASKMQAVCDVNRRQPHCKDRSVCVLVQDKEQKFFFPSAFPVVNLV